MSTPYLNLGIVSAYADAKRGGYTGTYDEFCALLAGIGGLQPKLTAGQNISIAGNVIDTKAFPCNPNILDDWYFGNPVNQRGQTEWLSSASARVPCVDRWNWWGQYVAGSTLKLLNDGLQLVGNPESEVLYQQITQKIEKDRLPVGATVTLSALVKAEADAAIILSIGGSNAAYVTVPANTWTLIAGVLNVPSVEQTHEISIARNTAGATFTVKAVKLELGSVQTLAHQDANGAWVLNEIPDYGEQLRRCQRYFVRIGDSAAGYTGTIGISNCANATGSNTFIPTPVTLRATPAITLHNIYLRKGTTDHEVTSVNSFSVSANGIFCALNSSDLPAGETLLVRAINGGYMDLSADL